MSAAPKPEAPAMPVDWISVPTRPLRECLFKIGHHERVRLAVMTSAEGVYLLAVAPDEFGAAWHLIPSV